MSNIGRDELRLKLQRSHAPKLVAVLSPWNYRKGHIPGSLHFTSIERALAALAPEDEIVLYCSGRPCMNSTWARQLLERHGYRNVRVYEGGLSDWASANLPLDRADKTPMAPANPG